MDYQKCLECGLMNFGGQAQCRDCKTPLRKFYLQPNTPGEIFAVETPSLYIFNGIGTKLMGWRHGDDETSTAIVWFTAFFLPLFPVSRWRLVSPTKANMVPAGEGPLRALNPVSFSTAYFFLERLPLSGEEVLRTYLFAYLWLPIKLIVPLIVGVHVLNSTKPKIDDGSMTPPLIGGAFSIIWMGYITFVIMRLFQRSPGAKT